METFCNDLKERATNIINYEKKKKKIPLTDEENSPIKERSMLYMQRKHLVLMMIKEVS